VFYNFWYSAGEHPNAMQKPSHCLGRRFPWLFKRCAKGSCDGVLVRCIQQIVRCSEHSGMTHAVLKLLQWQCNAIERNLVYYMPFRMVWNDMHRFELFEMAMVFTKSACDVRNR